MLKGGVFQTIMVGTSYSSLYHKETGEIFVEMQDPEDKENYLQTKMS